MNQLQHALDELEAAAAANVERSREIQRRIAWFRDQLERGRPMAEVVADEDPPRVVELLTINQTTLETFGSQVRAELAQSLRDEGLTINAIAELFGVTRQRISALLRQHAD